MDEQRAARLLGTWERRFVARDLEIRKDAGHTYTVRGYASTVENGYDVYGGPDKGGFTETIARGAFDKTLADKPDVVFLLNHQGMPLARTKSGTLSLAADNIGLLQEASIDRRDPEGQALEVKIERGDVDEMSFAFRVTRQEWNDDYTDRRITELNIDHGDVSAVTFGANPTTSIAVSARSAVAVLREIELSELRSEVSPDELREAHARLAELIERTEQKTSATVEVDVVPVLGEGEGRVTVARQLLAALLGDEERIDDVIAALRALGQPEAIEVVDGEGETVARVDEDGTAEFSLTEMVKDAIDEQTVAVLERHPERSVRSIARYREMYGVA